MAFYLRGCHSATLAFVSTKMSSVDDFIWSHICCRALQYLMCMKIHDYTHASSVRTKQMFAVKKGLWVKTAACPTRALTNFTLNVSGTEPCVHFKKQSKHLSLIIHHIWIGHCLFECEADPVEPGAGGRLLSFVSETDSLQHSSPWTATAMVSIHGHWTHHAPNLCCSNCYVALK